MQVRADGFYHNRLRETPQFCATTKGRRAAELLQDLTKRTQGEVVEQGQFHNSRVAAVYTDGGIAKRFPDRLKGVSLAFGGVITPQDEIKEDQSTSEPWGEPDAVTCVFEGKPIPVILQNMSTRKVRIPKGQPLARVSFFKNIDLGEEEKVFGHEVVEELTSKTAGCENEGGRPAANNKRAARKKRGEKPANGPRDQTQREVTQQEGKLSAAEYRSARDLAADIASGLKPQGISAKGMSAKAANGKPDAEVEEVNKTNELIRESKGEERSYEEDDEMVNVLSKFDCEVDDIILRICRKKVDEFGVSGYKVTKRRVQGGEHIQASLRS